ncbi:MAG: hypothetical protein R3E31_02890 [Chloroflexota bacterium]
MATAVLIQYGRFCYSKVGASEEEGGSDGGGEPEPVQRIITRTTYSLAGQPVAVRVVGDPDSTNNGRFYLYSDHASAALSTGSEQRQRHDGRGGQPGG